MEKELELSSAQSRMDSQRISQPQRCGKGGLVTMPFIIGLCPSTSDYVFLRSCFDLGVDLIWMNGSKWSTCEGGNVGASAQYDIVFDGKLQSSFRQSYQDTPLISCNHQFHASSRSLHCWFLSGSLPRCWFRFLHHFSGRYNCISYSFSFTYHVIL